MFNTYTAVAHVQYAVLFIIKKLDIAGSNR